MIKTILLTNNQQHTFFGFGFCLESDEELFEDNPEEYIRRDIEGSDVDTRRRAACDLVKALSRYFEPQITEVFGQYITVKVTLFFKLLFSIVSIFS